MRKWYEEEGKDRDIVTDTGVSLFRNLDGIPFPARMSLSDRGAVLERVRAAVCDPKGPFAERLRPVGLESVSDLQAVSLAERRLIRAELVSDRAGSGLLAAGDESLSVAVNGEDHLEIRAFAAGSRLDEAYAEADGLESYLDRALPFAFDPKLGYLTQNPVRLGTGMVAFLGLHLPALLESGSTARLSVNLSELGLSLQGVYGPEAAPRGAMFRLSNRVTLGISEREALANLNSMAGQIIARERRARELRAGDLDVQDTVWRNLGILQNARLLSYDEFLEGASAVRFGVACGLVKGMALSEIDALAVRVQPATLMLENGGALPAEERRALRAAAVREAFHQGMEGS